MFRTAQKLLVVSMVAALAGCSAQGSIGSGTPPLPKTWSWEGFRIAGTGGAADAPAPAIAVDAAGNGVLVWRQADSTDGRQQLWIARSGKSGAWTAPRPFRMPGTESAQHAQIVFDAGGNLLFVWQQPDGEHRSIRAVRAGANGVWGDIQRLERHDRNAADLALAADETGNTFAVWREDGDAGSEIRSRRYVAGIGWSAAQRVDAEMPARPGRPVLAVDRAGSALVAWEAQVGAGSQVWAARFDAHRGWESPRRLSVPATAAHAPHATFGRDGNAVVVWEQTKGGRRSVTASHSLAGGSWSAPQPISAAAVDAQRPVVALDRAGHGVAVWEQQEATRRAVWANRWIAGKGWLGAERIDGNPAMHARHPQVMMNTDGHAVVVWCQGGGTHANIVTARLADGRWSVPEVLDTDNIGALHTAVAEAPQLTRDRTGNVVAAWRQKGGVATEVRSDRFLQKDVTTQASRS